MDEARPGKQARGAEREGAERPLAALAEGADAVLFLCSGNILRSAFCELYARHLGCPLPVSSAATVYRNERIHPAAVRALARCGAPADLSADFVPRRVQEALPGLSPGTLVLGMDAGHLGALPPALRARAALVSRCVGSAAPVPDPISMRDPTPVFDHLARCVEALVEVLERA